MHHHPRRLIQAVLPASSTLSPTSPYMSLVLGDLELTLKSSPAPQAAFPAPRLAECLGAAPSLLGDITLLLPVPPLGILPNTSISPHLSPP
jgi:hypothetical protein